ncbi:MA3 domain-containing protein [Perilla frutescens var. hirtella]|uniref:MA3 domain-containing protein n=1 Tax=Perilla frutescens var. hirtella TaxID=608512 RepID=A0AAD4PCB5_PERFH|nr:MA3 domain-containing protein [Perilla frutescens var. hirtella]
MQMEGNANIEVVDSLQMEMESLLRRINQLETENAKLSQQLSNCFCKKLAGIVGSDRTPFVDCSSLTEEMETQRLDESGLLNISKDKEPDTCGDTMALHHLPKRYIALKVMYFGQRFYGFASEAQMDPTIESEIFKALEKTRLISGDKKELQYSRCGRTDKGVSSVAQVISLFMRSNLKDTSGSNGYSGETFAEESYDYIKILNRVLPNDIRILGWSPAPTNFSARFSCLSREYKYFFWRENLNITAMEIAGRKFIGEHDFRNFCKMDAASVHNYRRNITSFEVFSCNERYGDDELWAMKIKGSAFLWHQIRCMVAVLFLIGQGLESANVIDELLDVERTPRKPQYKMAPEIPLVLHSCEFDGLKFKCSSDSRQALRTHLEKECRSYKLQSAIFHEALQSSSCTFNDYSQLNSRSKKKEPTHIRLLSRPTEPSYDERRAKLAGGRAKNSPASIGGFFGELGFLAFANPFGWSNRRLKIPLDMEDARVEDDPNDPNYISDDKDDTKLTTKMNEQFEVFKKKATVMVEEYFANDDVTSTANELRELEMSSYYFYFVKKLVSIAMDRRDKEKEMASILLSSLYGDVFDPKQVYKGFQKLVQSADDLIVDIPDAVDVLALFIARAIVDDILPPSFLTKTMAYLSKGSKGVDVIKRAEKGYLSAPLHAEIIERCWGGSKNKTVEDLKVKINDLLVEYVVSGDVKEARRCIKDLHVPHFHHEIVKRAILMAMEKRQAEGRLLELLKRTSEEGLINSSQISKGFSRIIDSVDDLSLDIPNAKVLLQSLISKAASEGWLSASSLRSLSLLPGRQVVEDSIVKAFKKKIESIIREYFLSGDVSEVICCLEFENSCGVGELNAVFVKKLISLAMERKNREKEMASVLLSSLCLPSDDVVSGFIMLIESAEDMALDIPIVVEDLAMFIARAEVDEVLTPQEMEEIGRHFPGTESIGNKVTQMSMSLVKARLSGERILRCWGGGGTLIEDVKEKVGKLLEEYAAGGETREACRCIKELGMPFFHHEVVKKCLVIMMENCKNKNGERMWSLLRDCFDMQLITINQMTKGFVRVNECLDDLALDVPDAKQQFAILVQRAASAGYGWLDTSLLLTNFNPT